MTRSYHAPSVAPNAIAPQGATLFDRLPVPVHAGARHTERRAAKRIAPIAPTLRMRALQWVKDAGDVGLTAHQAGVFYAESRGRHPLDGSSRYSMAPRLTELAQAGFIRDSGKVRGGFIVWVWTGLEGDANDIKRPKPAKEPGCQSNH